VSRPASLRDRIFEWYERADKSLLANLAFLSAILLSATLLFTAVGIGWWTNNLAPAIEVNGTSISVGPARQRAQAEAFLLQQKARQIRSRVSAGTLTNEQGNIYLEEINTAQGEISSKVTSDMIDSILIAQLATSRGVTVDQQLIDEQYRRLYALPELRRLRRITLDVADDPATGAPSEKTTAEAMEIGQSISDAATDVETFARLAKESSDDSYAEEGGLVGWSSRSEDPASDLGYQAAWELKTVGVTEPIKRSVDQVVIFYVEQIRPSQQDLDFESSAREAGIDLSVFTALAGEEALREALGSTVVEELLREPVEQREVSVFTVPVPADSGIGEEILVRHVLFSPNDDALAASEIEDPEDPAWIAAKTEADEAMKSLTDGSAQFDVVASMSDDESSASEGGLLPWATRGTFAEAFDQAVWADDAQSGRLIGPVRTQFGYHIIRVEGRRPGLDVRIGELRTKLLGTEANFAEQVELAKEEFDGSALELPGFVVRYAINREIGDLAWTTDVGELSPVTQIGDQYVIVRVNKAESGVLTLAQKNGIRAAGFLIWLDRYRSAAEIKIDGAVVQAATESPAP